ncbi:ScbA/BarX family gamma-butyrolactone biosynthesis protein [Streptomyces sp. XH2]|uniref:ScbA/BarX family gamma-butyrolactone biosynthesis protein n=1 Tax=Streptomyces sp. XH2 TaxID=3412483 RepID=UPI003C7CC9DD
MLRKALGTPAVVTPRAVQWWQPPILKDDSTVARQLVHKHAVEQVFVTDVRVFDDRLVTSAQLPRQHRFYNDGLTPYYDLLLVGEVVRQSLEAIAHQLMEVPFGAHFILHGMGIELLDPAAFRIYSTPTNVVSQVIPVETQRRQSDGWLLGLTGSGDCWVAGRLAARTSFEVSFLSEESYRGLRQGAEAGPRVSEAGRRWAEAALVGRHDSANVVIGELDLCEDCTTAVLMIDIRHPVFFDHPQDHFSGSAVLEGCRQIAVAAVASTADVPRGLLITSCHTRFHSFAELAADVLYNAVPERTPHGTRVIVRAEQCGRLVSEAEFHFATLTENPA